MNRENHILVLGGGHMGGALARSWVKAGYAVTVVERDAARREALAAQGLVTVGDVATILPAARALVLAIKPQQWAEMLPILKPLCSASPTAAVLSIMAGIPLAALQQLSPEAVRLMPNLPASIGEGMTAGFAPHASPATRALSESLFQTVGKFCWVAEEALLHGITAVSGSGPGFFFAFLEAMEEAAVAQGFTPAQATLLVRQTLRGAALLADQSDASAAALQQMVASPGGTTQAGLETLAAHQLKSVITHTVEAAAQRSRTLAP